MLDILFSAAGCATVAFVVTGVLSRLSEKSHMVTTTSIYKFVMRPVKDVSYIGMAVSGFALLCIIGSSYADQFEGITAAIFVGMFLLGIFTTLASVKGFWDVTVDGDIVTSSRIWIIKKKMNIHEITHCEETRGGIHIYKHGRKKKYISIDSMSGNLDNWYRRMEKEGIEVVNPFDDTIETE